MLWGWDSIKGRDDYRSTRTGWKCGYKITKSCEHSDNTCAHGGLETKPRRNSGKSRLVTGSSVPQESGGHQSKAGK